MVKGYQKKELRLLFRGDAAFCQAGAIRVSGNKERSGTPSGFPPIR